MTPDLRREYEEACRRADRDAAIVRRMNLALFVLTCLLALLHWTGVL